MNTTVKNNTSGKFELTEEEFKKLSAGKEVLTFNIKTAFPDLFADTDKVPRMLERIWRRAIDDILYETKGAYTNNGSTNVDVIFDDLPPAAGKVKLDILKNKLPELLKDVENGKIDLDQPSEIASKPQKFKTEQKDVPSELELLIKEGLKENPSIEVLNMWAMRTLQDVISSKAKIPLTKDMIAINKNTNVIFSPLWTKSNQTLVGSSPAIKIGLPSKQYNSGEKARQDLILLFSGVLQIYNLLAKKEHPLIFFPIDFTNLQNKKFIELYIAFLKRLSANVKMAIIFEFKNVPKGSITKNIKEIIESIVAHGRSFVFETSLLTYADYKKEFPKLYACGFDMDSYPVPPGDLMRLTKKFQEHYTKQGLKPYIKSVKTPQAFTIATSLDFLYIAGDIIEPAQKEAFSLKKLSLDDILQ